MLSTGSYLSHLIPKTILWSRRSFYPRFVEKEGWVCRVTRPRSCSKADGYSLVGETGSCIDKIRCSFLMYISNYFSIHTQDNRNLSPLFFPSKHCRGPTSRCPETVGVQQELRKKWSALPGQRKWAGDCEHWESGLPPAPGIEKPQNRKQPHCQLIHTKKHARKKPQLWLSSTQTWELRTLQAFPAELYLRNWWTNHRIEY